MWYRFRATTTTAVEIYTSGSNYYTALTVFTGTKFSNLDYVACRDDNDNQTGHGTAELGFRARPGVTYYIQAAGGDTGSKGTLKFHARKLTVPANDTRAHATTITKLPYTGSVHVLGALNTGNPRNDCTWNPNTVWLKFKPTSNMTVRADTLKSKFYGGIAVFRGSGKSFRNVGIPFPSR